MKQKNCFHHIFLFLDGVTSAAAVVGLIIPSLTFGRCVRRHETALLVDLIKTVIQVSFLSEPMLLPQITFMWLQFPGGCLRAWSRRRHRRHMLSGGREKRKPYFMDKIINTRCWRHRGVFFFPSLCLPSNSDIRSKSVKSSHMITFNNKNTHVKHFKFEPTSLFCVWFDLNHPIMFQIMITREFPTLRGRVDTKSCLAAVKRC